MFQKLGYIYTCIREIGIITDHQLFIKAPNFVHIKKKKKSCQNSSKAKEHIYSLRFSYKSEIQSRFIKLWGNLGQVLSEFWKIIVFNENCINNVFDILSFGHIKYKARNKIQGAHNKKKRLDLNLIFKYIYIPQKCFVCCFNSEIYFFPFNAKIDNTI